MSSESTPALLKGAAGVESTASGGPAPAEVASAKALESFRATKRKSLNFGLGVDSTALALAIINDPTAFGVAEDFSDFSVVTAMTGFDFPDTMADVDIGKSGYWDLRNACRRESSAA